jgi:hypothetical protein
MPANIRKGDGMRLGRSVAPVSAARETRAARAFFSSTTLSLPVELMLAASGGSPSPPMSAKYCAYTSRIVANVASASDIFFSSRVR